MRIINHILLLLFFMVLSCKKESIQEPINKDANQEILGCATCISSLYQIAYEAIEEEVTICDDFTEYENWPSIDLLSGEIIGYSQEGTQAITVGEGTFGSVNGTTLFPGIYALGDVHYSFDGSEQVARFNIYGLDYQYGEMGFSVNGSELAFMNDPFPMVLGGVTIDLDDSAEDLISWVNAYLIFSGEIETITILGFESGVTELCVTKTTASETPVIDKSGPIYYSEFYNYDGTVLGYYANYKTPSGYYGGQGVTLDINFEDFLAYTPSKISFVHAHLEDYSKLINIKLPSTPLIVTIPDSLEYYLSPYGYKVEVYHQMDGYMWINSTADAIYGALVDSIIIKGNDLSHIEIGANLQYSELRSICTYYQ